MAGAIVDLEVPCRIKGKDSSNIYTISFVSNWAVRQYKELTEDSIMGFREVMALRTGEKKVDEVDKAVISKFETLLDRKYAIVKDILETNDYQFDLEFWDRCCDPNVVNDFIKNSIHKDMAGQKKTAPPPM